MEGADGEGTRKRFDAIQSDYSFFERHVTEIEKNSAALAPFIREAGMMRGRLRLLDFGCGEGHVLRPLLIASGLPAATVEVALVEPLDAYLARAVEAMRGVTTHAVEAWPALPAGERFDVIVSHHVLYYVPDLDHTLDALLSALRPDGVLLIVMGASDHPLILMWHAAFGHYPYFVSDDLSRALEARDVEFERRTVDNRLRFEDTHENRMRIIRFMFGDRLPAIDLDSALRYIDSFRAGATIDMAQPDHLFVVRPRG